MNRSGAAVAALCQFFKIAPDELLVAHDELDIDPGTARYKTGGGHGGHNGLRDTIARWVTAMPFIACASASAIPAMPSRSPTMCWAGPARPSDRPSMPRSTSAFTPCPMP